MDEEEVDTQVSDPEKEEEEEEEVDIYGDIDLPYINAVKKCQNQIHELQQQVYNLQEELEVLDVENKGLKKRNRTLEINISILYKTARAEVQRKTNHIMAVRKELDDLITRQCLRYISREELEEILNRTRIDPAPNFVPESTSPPPPELPPGKLLVRQTSGNHQTLKIGNISFTILTEQGDFKRGSKAHIIDTTESCKDQLPLEENRSNLPSPVELDEQHRKEAKETSPSEKLCLEATPEGHENTKEGSVEGHCSLRESRQNSSASREKPARDTHREKSNSPSKRTSVKKHHREKSRSPPRSHRHQVPRISRYHWRKPLEDRERSRHSNLKRSRREDYSPQSAWTKRAKTTQSPRRKENCPNLRKRSSETSSRRGPRTPIKSKREEASQKHQLISKKSLKSPKKSPKGKMHAQLLENSTSRRALTAIEDMMIEKELQLRKQSQCNGISKTDCRANDSVQKHSEIEQVEKTTRRVHEDSRKHKEVASSSQDKCHLKSNSKSISNGNQKASSFKEKQPITDSDVENFLCKDSFSYSPEIKINSETVSSASEEKSVCATVRKEFKCNNPCRNGNADSSHKPASKSHELRSLPKERSTSDGSVDPRLDESLQRDSKNERMLDKGLEQTSEQKEASSTAWKLTPITCALRLEECSPSSSRASSVARSEPEEPEETVVVVSAKRGRRERVLSNWSRGSHSNYSFLDDTSTREEEKVSSPQHSQGNTASQPELEDGEIFSDDEALPK